MLRILIFPYILFECLITILFIQNYGFFIFLAEVFISLIFGFLLIKNFKLFSLLQLISNSIFRNFAPVIAGILFIIPGILSDIIAIFFAIYALVLKFKNRNLQNFKNVKKENYQNSDEIIDVEVIEDSKIN